MSKKEEKRERPVYLGTRLTAGTARTYMESQKEAFINRYNEALEKGNIKEDDIVDENELQKLAEEFAIFMRNKMNKQFKAYLKGKKTFKYKGNTYPVMTSETIHLFGKSLKSELIKEEENE